MKKFDNHVYMLICEVTLKLYKETNCMTHSSYCRLMSASLKDGVLSKKETKHISIISDVLGNIFSFNNKESGEYISTYFSLGKYEKFEEPVRLVQEFFPNCGKVI